MVGRAAERIGVLVDDLLIYARRESPADRETVRRRGRRGGRLRGRVRRRRPRPAGLQLRRHRAEEACSVHGDPVALQQALANLLANAVRLAPAGIDRRRPPPGGRGTGCGWRCRTRVPASPRRTSRRCSSASTGAIPPGPVAEGRSGLGLDHRAADRPGPRRLGRAAVRGRRRLHVLGLVAGVGPGRRVGAGSGPGGGQEADPAPDCASAATARASASSRSRAADPASVAG